MVFGLEPFRWSHCNSDESFYVILHFSFRLFELNDLTRVEFKLEISSDDAIRGREFSLRLFKQRKTNEFCVKREVRVIFIDD